MSNVHDMFTSSTRLSVQHTLKRTSWDSCSSAPFVGSRMTSVASRAAEKRDRVLLSLQRGHADRDAGRHSSHTVTDAEGTDRRPASGWRLKAWGAPCCAHSIKSGVGRGGKTQITRGKLLGLRVSSKIQTDIKKKVIYLAYECGWIQMVCPWHTMELAVCLLWLERKLHKVSFAPVFSGLAKFLAQTCCSTDIVR